MAACSVAAWSSSYSLQDVEAFCCCCCSTHASAAHGLLRSLAVCCFVDPAADVTQQPRAGSSVSGTRVLLQHVGPLTAIPVLSPPACYVGGHSTNAFVRVMGSAPPSFGPASSRICVYSRRREHALLSQWVDDQPGVFGHTTCQHLSDLVSA